MGRLSDLFGRRWIFIGGNTVALIGGIVCATSPNVHSLIVGAAVFGLGEAIQLSFAAAVGELVPNKHRPFALSFIFLTSAPIATFGTVISRKFIENPNLGWRWCFYINIIDMGLAVILLFFCYHPPSFNLLHERKTKREMTRQLDYLGMALWVAGLTIFLLGISWGGVIYPWKSAAVISCIIIGICLLVALGLWETFGKLKYPIIPVQFFKNRGYMALVCCATVASVSR
jgi:MFS family permease